MQDDTRGELEALKARVEALGLLMEERKEAEHRAIDLLRETFPTQRDLAEWREQMNSKMSEIIGNTAGKSTTWGTVGAVLLALASIIVTFMKR